MSILKKTLLLGTLKYLMIMTVSSAPMIAKRTPTLLISSDGFRADYLDTFLKENPNSYLQKLFVEVGAKADYMLPSFPSLTFPNHYTLVTGLYMEDHGIVGNSFYDSKLKEKVNLIGDTKSNSVRYWNNTEPIWESAKKQGLKTGSVFWTGSEVWGKHPDMFLSYNNGIKFESRCDEVVNWFDKFNLDFGTLYFNEPDHTGHDFGPESEEYRKQIKVIDKVIGYLLTKLESRKVLDKINVILVSDHGMARMTNTIILKDYFDPALIDTSKSTFGVVSNLHPKKQADLTKLYEELKKIEGLDVYYRQDVPERLHYSKNDNRIAPIVAIAHEGYVIYTKSSTLKGNHGFDNNIESMRAIFLARGPDFKRNSRIGPLNNVDVYPLLCQLIDMECHPNNGTISNFIDALVNPLDPRYAQKNLNFIKQFVLI